MKHIMKCVNRHYTMKEACPECSQEAREAKPAKYSPEDKYGKYRRIAKQRADGNLEN